MNDQYDMFCKAIIDKKLIVYGAGDGAIKTLEYYPDLIRKVDYFVDNNETKRGKTLFDKPIFSPREIELESNMRGGGGDCCVSS
ncbi:MAG: hypothetical protein LBG04_04200 [Holosporaceae bacterium]|jgi:hypothetical protein|nr:hypothetical protein [Holosporaceae bacterium]